MPVSALKHTGFSSGPWGPVLSIRVGEYGFCIGSPLSQKAKVLLVACRDTVGPSPGGTVPGIGWPVGWGMRKGSVLTVAMGGCWVSVRFGRIGRLRAVRSKFLASKQAG